MGDSKAGVEEKETGTRVDGPSSTADRYDQIFRITDHAGLRSIERRLKRKIDSHLLPIVIMLYLLNYLDRSNIAQARQGSLEEDLGMKGTDFNLATSIFFVGYLLIQLPTNLLLTRLPPSVFVACVCFVWGAISAAMGAVKDFKQLLVVRFFLGFAEAPFFPGAIFLMSSWYTRGELTVRIGWMFCGNALANMFGGLLGAAILGNMDDARGIAGWRWLFIIEGSVASFFSIFVFLFLPNYPHTTQWLTEEEQAYAAWRLQQDAKEVDDSHSQSILEGVKMAVTDYRLYLFILLQHCGILVQTFAFFFPSILNSLNYSRITTLWLTAPVWFFTFLVSISVTYSSSRTGDRSMHIIGLMVVACVGNAVASGSHNFGARFFSMFLVPVTVPAYQIIVSWVANSFPRPFVKRSASIAIANMIANCGSIYGSYMYPIKDYPQYVPGGVAVAAACVFIIALVLVIRYIHVLENRKLQATQDEYMRTSGATEVPEHLQFRYIL